MKRSSLIAIIATLAYFTILGGITLLSFYYPIVFFCMIIGLYSLMIYGVYSSIKKDIEDIHEDAE
jgi:hypothetical protein